MVKPPKSPDTMKLDFEAVAKHYGVTRSMEREVLRAMVKHPYITPIKVAQQNVRLANVAHTTLTKTISELKKRGVPFTKSRARDNNNTLYTRYHLNRAKVAQGMAAVLK